MLSPLLIVPVFILYTHISACPVVLQKDEGSEDEVDDTLTEEKHASDLDNESEMVSGEVSQEEFTEEEGSPGTEAAAGSSERSTEASVRKRKPQGPNSPEAT